MIKRNRKVRQGGDECAARVRIIIQNKRAKIKYRQCNEPHLLTLQPLRLMRRQFEGVWVGLRRTSPQPPLCLQRGEKKVAQRDDSNVVVKTVVVPNEVERGVEILIWAYQNFGMTHAVSNIHPG
jgi:hypothetical protein